MTTGYVASSAITSAFTLILWCNASWWNASRR